MEAQVVNMHLTVTMFLILELQTRKTTLRKIEIILWKHKVTDNVCCLGWLHKWQHTHTHFSFYFAKYKAGSNSLDSQSISDFAGSLPTLEYRCIRSLTTLEYRCISRQDLLIFKWP